jgi:hypothetical protein
MNAPGTDRSSHLAMLGLFAACCIAPMLLIVVLTTVVGLTLGLSAAFSLGIVAAALCVGVMVVRHRSHRPAPSVEG